MARILYDWHQEFDLLLWSEDAPRERHVRFGSAHEAHAFLRSFRGDPLVHAALRGALEDLGARVAYSDDEALLEETAARLAAGHLRLRARPKTWGSLYGKLAPKEAPAEPPPPAAPPPPPPPAIPNSASTTVSVEPPCRWSLDASAEGATPEDDVFEQQPLRLDAKVVQGKSKDPAGTFVVTRAGAALATQPVATGAGQASWAFPLPLVEGEQACYRVNHKLVVGGDTYDGAKTFTVWPRTVTLRALRATDGKALKGFSFRVKQGDAGEVVVTGESGEVVYSLKKPAPFTVDAEPPGEVKAWTKSKGRVRECKAEKKYRAEFVAPQKPADGKAIEQMVNLATTSHGQDGKGHLVTIKVGAAGGAGEQNDVIHVQVTFGRESRRDSPKPALQGALGVTEAGSVFKGHVKLGPQGEAATFRLALGFAGGDTCEVKIGSTPACGDATLRFENWRTLYYQLTRPSTLTAPSMADITAGLEAVKVRYEKYKELAFAEADTPAAPAGSWFDGAMVGLSGRCVNIGDHNRTFFHSKFDDTKNPLGVHLLVCHTQFDGGSPAHAKSIDVALTGASPAVAFPLGGAGTAPGYHVAFARGENVFPKALQDGADGVRDVTWASLAPAGPHRGAAGAVPADHVSVDWVNHRNEVAIKLPAGAVAVLAAGHGVQLRAKVLYCKGPYNGEAVKNKQLIRDRPASEGGAKGMNGTMTHELGHTMSQAVTTAPPGLAATDHDRTYTGRGHQGPHCAEGIAQAVYDAAGKTGSLKGREDCKCVMYGEGATNRPVKFCAKCSPFVLAEALTSIA